MSEPSQHQVHLIVPLATASQWIRKEIKTGYELPTGSLGSRKSLAVAVNENIQWLKVVEELLGRIFDKSDVADDWRLLNFDQINSEPDRPSKSYKLYTIRNEYLVKLAGILKRLPYIVEALPIQGNAQTNISVGTGREVFVVHGHNNEAKAEVARFLMILGLKPIILEEEPSAGRTIIEKLEASYLAEEVVFAVVIMTADDRGAAKDQTRKLQPRARQNVVMELGYSIGLLGRDRVCALYQSGVEMPSDYHGVVYVPLDDSGAWKLALARELKTAGIDVDLNKVY